MKRTPRVALRTVRVCALMLVSAALLTGPASAVPISGVERDFSFTLPEGFERVAVDETNAASLYSFVLRSPAGRPDITVDITPSEPSPGPSRRMEDWQRYVPDGLELIRVERTRWQSRDLDVLYARPVDDPTGRVVRMVHIPLRRDPVRILMESDAGRDAEASVAFREILRSFQSTNVLPVPALPPERSDVPWGQVIMYITLGAVVAVVAAFVFSGGAGRG